MFLIGIAEFICIIVFFSGFIKLFIAFFKKQSKKISLAMIVGSFAAIIALTSLAEACFPEEMEASRIKNEECRHQEELENSEKENQEAQEEKEENVADTDELPKESENIDIENEETADITDGKVQEDSFLTALKSQLDETVANEAYDIFKNDLGFDTLTFIKKMDDTTNYVISANGTEVVLTASDKVYRIFIPNSDTVFYEDDTVKMTVKQYEDKQISYGDQSAYYIIAKTIVESALKNPSSAKFPSINTEAGSITIERNGALVVVQSYVDAKNSFNAMVRSNWTVEFMVYDLSAYSYDALYIEIDGEKSGEYIKLDDWVQP